MIEHWLLDLAVEFPIWLSQIFPSVDTEGLNVKAVPECEAGDYARALVELYDSGAIALFSDDPKDNVQSSQGVRRIVHRFLKLRQNGPPRPLYERNRRPGMRVCFTLTSRGGEAWESVAQPNWSRIVTVSTDLESGVLCSPNRDLLVAFMGWYREIEEQQIALETITCRPHQDFDILYWKQLPLVYRCSFALRPATPEWPRLRPPEWFRDWYISAIAWHKKPWDLPNWPAS